ncbi:hypothetical protein HR060_06290 [Catenovulum sp. SM1970]|uniref:hypothetical protein n=1 Tax=Marinifaba aquimaris TaxID=2741323 RepID=UPI0015740917|nr:hypothetical protein [Marinifaba aquimaris]NTS76475.1 hypothetical protein [Marinifaba aquimaris]
MNKKQNANINKGVTFKGRAVVNQYGASTICTLLSLSTWAHTAIEARLVKHMELLADPYKNISIFMKDSVLYKNQL